MGLSTQLPIFTYCAWNYYFFYDFVLKFFTLTETYKYTKLLVIKENKKKNLIDYNSSCLSYQSCDVMLAMMDT